MGNDGSSDSGRPNPRDGGGAATLGEAETRILAYWADECARDLGKLLAHFTSNAEVITPDAIVRGHDAIASLYQKSFDSFPGLTVEVKAGFTGRGAHCFEYGAVLSDADGETWLVEGINLIMLDDGLISSLRSFEDAPRRIATGGASNSQRTGGS